MKKQITIIAITFLLVISLLSGVSATTVFLTSDHIGSENNDLNMLNSVKNYIEEFSDGRITAVVDSQAPSPGEGTRAIQSNADVSVNFAASCAGNFLILAKAVPNLNKQVIFVNTGDFDLDNENYLRRAWDDNYSSQNFAGINYPGKFLKNAGIDYIQPLKEYPKGGSTYTSSDDEINRYIAQQVVNKIENPITVPDSYDSSLVVTHSLNPAVMAKASNQLYQSDDSYFNGTYNGYTAPQLLYLTSSYLNGNGLKSPAKYNPPSNPLRHSVLAKDSYSISDYMAMGGIVSKYMDETGTAPDSISYNGATIGYYDLLYNFARITQNHTDSSNMGFVQTYRFDKVEHSLIIDLLPYIGIGLILIIILAIIRRIRRKRRNRRR